MIKPLQPFEIKDYFNFTPKQKEAYAHIGTGKVLFYGGTRGGGKSHLIRAAHMLISLQKPGIITNIIRKTYRELNQNFVSVILKDYPPEVFGYVYRKQDNSMTFSNGSVLYFQPLAKKADLEKIQGVESQMTSVDEANNFPWEWLEDIRASVRNARIPNWRATFLMSGNAGGSNDHYFKTRFIKPDYSKWTENELVNKDTYVYVPATAYDNPYLDEDYITKNLASMRESRKKTWLEADWDFPDGQFFETWNEEFHVVDDFQIPESWRIACGFDLGFSKAHPSVCLYGAQDPSNGDVYICKEYLGTGAVEEHAIMIAHLASSYNYPIVYGDPSMFNDENSKKRISDISTSQVFFQYGITLVPADNKRVDGWRHVKQWLNYYPGKTKPKLKFFRSCVNTVEHMPLFRYNPRTTVKTEDLDTDQPMDDIADALRYLLKSGFDYPVHDDLTIDMNEIVFVNAKEQEKFVALSDNAKMEIEIARYSKQNNLQYYDRYKKR